MTAPTRENSGLRLAVNKRGRMYFSVHGKNVPSIGVTVEDTRERVGSVLTLKIPMRLVEVVQIDD